MMLSLLLAMQAADLADLVGPPPVAPVCSVTLVVDVDEEGETPERSVYRYDRTTDDWSYVSYNGAPPDAEELEKFARDGRDGGDRDDTPTPPADFYREAVENAQLGWVQVAPPGADGIALWAADDLPKGTIDANGRDVSKLIRLRYSVAHEGETARIIAGGGALKKPWRIPLIARIDGFEIERRFAAAGPETGVPGTVLPVAEHLKIEADVLGRDRSAVIETSYEGWDCVPGGADAVASADGPA